MCVMRTGYAHPLFKTFSYDKGFHWTKPEPFTPNGVYPILKRLKNNVIVLVSGRPGLQLRFSIDGDGKVWTEPIDMMSFITAQGTYDIYSSCGYGDILLCDDGVFYLVYSDFKTKNLNGEYRKSIMFRRIEIIKQTEQD